jgi:hypothetical protein
MKSLYGIIYSGIERSFMEKHDIHILIANDKLKKLQELVKIDRRSISVIVDIAIGQYLNKRKVLEN